MTMPFPCNFQEAWEEAGVEEMEWLNRRRTPLLHFKQKHLVEGWNKVMHPRIAHR